MLQGNTLLIIIKSILSLHNIYIYIYKQIPLLENNQNLCKSLLHQFHLYKTVKLLNHQEYIDIFYQIIWCFFIIVYKHYPMSTGVRMPIRFILVTRTSIVSPSSIVSLTFFITGHGSNNPASITNQMNAQCFKIRR